MEGQSSFRKQAKFSWRILCSSGRILQSLVPEHPDYSPVFIANEKKKKTKPKPKHSHDYIQQSI